MLPGTVEYGFGTVEYEVYCNFVFLYRNYTALILARGGSKQVPRKNLAVVGDKTLLRRTIETAKLAGGESLVNYFNYL